MTFGARWSTVVLLAAHLAAALLVAAAAAPGTAQAQAPAPASSTQLDPRCVRDNLAVRHDPPLREELLLAVTTDRPVYAVGEAVTLTLFVTSLSDRAVTIEIAGPFADYSVRAASTGAEVWRYGIGRLFFGVSLLCTIQPGEAAVFSHRWDQRTPQAGPDCGMQVPAGEYSVTATFAALQPRPLAAGPAAFTIDPTLRHEGDEPSECLLEAARRTTYAFPSGCSTLIWPFADGTPIVTILAATRPASAIVGVWRFDAARGRYEGWSPLSPAAGELTSLNRLDAVLICLREPGIVDLPRA
jgi:hypothetical protein